MEIKPIKNRKDYANSLKRLGELMDAKPGSKAGDELDIIATLVESYEARHFPISAPNPVAAIQFAMEQQGLDRKDLEPYFGSRARVSEILNGKRSLTLAMIRKLHHGLGIPADALIG